MLESAAVPWQLQDMTPIRSSAPVALRRREFLRWGAGAVLAGSMARPWSALGAHTLEPLPPGVKISLQISTDATDEDLQFARQLGVQYVKIGRAHV